MVGKKSWRACSSYICKKWEWIILSIVLTMVFLIRFKALNLHPAPPSEDLASDLVVLEAYLCPVTATRPYLVWHQPPLYYFIIVLPFTRIFAVLMALKVYAAFTSAIVGVPFFLICQEITNRRAIPSLLATLLFTFSDLFNEMVGWAGGLNFFGIFVMLFSLLFFIKAIKMLKLKYIILSSIFTSFTVGTHSLTAVYLGISLLTTIMLLVTRRLISLKNVTKLFGGIAGGALMSIPYAPIYLFLFNNKVNVLTIAGLNYQALLYMLSKWLTVTVLILSLATVSFYTVFKYWQDKHISTIIISSGLATLFLLLILGPLPERALYYLPVPIFLALAIFLALIENWIKGSKRGASKISVATLVTTLLFFILLSSYNRLWVATGFYQVVDSNTLDALDWALENIPRDAVLFTNIPSLGMWIEGYTHHLSLSPKPLNSFVTLPDYEEAFNAILIDVGNHILMNGYLLIPDHFPADYDNPGIYVRTPFLYERLIYFSDEYPKQLIEFETLGTSFITHCLSSEEEFVTVINNPSDFPTIQYTYNWNFGTVARRIELSNEPNVLIMYAANFSQSTIKRIEVLSMIYSVNELMNYSIESRNVYIDVRTPLGNLWKVQISLLDASCPQFEIAYAPLDSYNPAFRFSIFADSPTVSFTLEIKIHTRVSYGRGAMYVDTIQLLEKFKVDYILLDKQRYDQVVRFTKGYNYFTPVYENRKIIILKFLGENAS